MYKGGEQVLEILIKSKRSLEFSEVVSLTSFNEDTVRRIIESLKSEGYINTSTKDSVTGIPTSEFSSYVSSEFPEVSVFNKSVRGASIQDLTQPERSIGLKWAKAKGFITIDGGKIIPSKPASEIDLYKDSLKEVFHSVKSTGACDQVIMEELFERKLLTKKIMRSFTISYTGKVPPSSSAAFDFNIPSTNAPIGKAHPISKLSERIRTIMTELGFHELEGNIVESSFWNFDALFQPQDHPARELADTFYVSGESPLPQDKSLVDRVRKAHETGWKYKWDPKEASKKVLRTHTTCLSARALAEIKDKGKTPRKYFAIGRVFRNEATDYKHLAEFHQVEGIIAWEDATFTDLLGTLKEFYRKLGFEKIRFRPSFFPYTEPSLEIEVYFDKRKQWMELGGAGIFRPEVSIPLAGTYPVLAWGLSLERPLMLMLDLEDIRTFYKNDVDFLLASRLKI